MRNRRIGTSKTRAARTGRGPGRKKTTSRQERKTAPRAVELAAKGPRAKAEALLKERKKLAKVKGRVDNAALYAGSPMYFYCYGCGLESDVLPESFTCEPNHWCRPCGEMRDEGWLKG